MKAAFSTQHSALSIQPPSLLVDYCCSDLVHTISRLLVLLTAER